MKMKFLFLVAHVLATFVVRDASATLNIYSNANPFFMPGYDINITSSGTAQYTIYHEAGSNQALDYFAMRFDASVFTSFSFVSALIDGATNVSFVQLGDQLIAGGLSLAPGSSILLTVSYSFVNGFGASALSWPEGDAWSQSFAGIGFSPGQGFGMDGGSTGLSPEPGTIVLLGSGLLGLGLIRRYLWRTRHN